MHRLSPDLDLSFFRNKALLQVCVGANELILNFDEGVSITVTSRVGFVGRNDTSDSYEDFARAGPAAIALLNDVVVSANGDTDGTLSLNFHSGVRLEFYDTSDRYESYLIRNGQQTIVV